MEKILFIDRDGTIVQEPEDEQIDSLSKIRFVQDAIGVLRKICEEMNFKLVMVTNQDGLGTPSFPEKDFYESHNFILDILAGEGIVFGDILIDRTFPEDESPTRKPGTGLLTKYIHGDYDLDNSYVIGDRATDMMLAKNLGCKGILVNAFSENTLINSELNDLVFKAQSWRNVYSYLRKQFRQASLTRVTNETNIRIQLNLDGRGLAEISTGIKFLDHMLGQIPRHSGFDLSILARGDTEVDEHHTIEDIALVLGSAFKIALGNKIGIQRYGFCLPMDDSIALVAIDFGGRPWLNWEVEFNNATIGGIDTDMFFHFFKSFCDTVECNLFIKAKGKNGHHLIESVFKAFAKSMKVAVLRDKSNLIPSTKGIL